MNLNTMLKKSPKITRLELHGRVFFYYDKMCDISLPMSYKKITLQTTSLIPDKILLQNLVNTRIIQKTLCKEPLRNLA